MLTSDDRAQMVADLAAVRADNPASITIRRGSTTLAAQTVRIARLGGGGRPLAGNGVQEARGQVIVTGSTSLDIQADDRFNDANGTLYRVTFVRPSRLVDTVAEAETVQ